jgi:hypothetical protein
MRRHFHPRNGAAESFVSCIPLFDGLVVAPHIVDWLRKVELGDPVARTIALVPSVETRTEPDLHSPRHHRFGYRPRNGPLPR